MAKPVHLPVTENPGLSPRGYFRNAVLCGVFQPGGEDSAATTSHYGLSLYMNTQYGTFRDEDGVWYNIQRMVEGELTVAAFVCRMGDRGIMPESNRSYTGRVFWSLNGGEHVTESLAPMVPAEPGGYCSEPLRLVQTATSGVWDEGGLMTLSGPCVAGFQWYVPAPEGGTFFTAHPHRASGTFLGKKVEGFFYNDQIYLPRGLSYPLSPFWSSVHVALVTGGTEYEDGTIEAFQIGLGRDRYAFACITDSSGVLHETTRVTGVMQRDDHGFPTHILWDIDGVAWEWIPDDRPELGGLSADGDPSIPAYRASEGRVRRVGDTRKPVAWMGYVETFAARG